jgi:hypothetical protein
LLLLAIRGFFSHWRNPKGLSTFRVYCVKMGMGKQEAQLELVPFFTAEYYTIDEETKSSG